MSTNWSERDYKSGKHRNLYNIPIISIIKTFLLHSNQEVSHREKPADWKVALWSPAALPHSIRKREIPYPTSRSLPTINTNWYAIALLSRTDHLMRVLVKSAVT